MKLIGRVHCAVVPTLHTAFYVLTNVFVFVFVFVAVDHLEQTLFLDLSTTQFAVQVFYNLLI